MQPTTQGLWQATREVTCRELGRALRRLTSRGLLSLLNFVLVTTVSAQLSLQLVFARHEPRWELSASEAFAFGA